MRSAKLPLFTTIQERDLRLDIFRGNLQSVYCAVVIAEADGIISGLERAAELAGGLKLSFDALVAVGDPVGKGEAVCRITGDPVSLLKGEEAILGALSKSSGIASAASRARKGAARSRPSNTQSLCFLPSRPAVRPAQPLLVAFGPGAPLR